MITTIKVPMPMYMRVASFEGSGPLRSDTARDVCGGSTQPLEPKTPAPSGERAA